MVSEKTTSALTVALLVMVSVYAALLTGYIYGSMNPVLPVIERMEP